MEIDLLKFCAREDGRYKISQPFFRGDGWKYATDGVYCVRVKSDGEKTPDSIKADELFKAETMASESVPIDESLFVPMLETDKSAHINGIKCFRCAGTGRESKDCPTCNGCGSVECDKCGHDLECFECNNGKIVVSNNQCMHCIQGVRYADIAFAQGVRVDGSRLKYMMLNLPNLRVLPASFIPDHRPIAFVFDGGEALLMPLIN